MIDQRDRLMDGFGTLERGMDSGREPSLLPSNQAAFLHNATVRGGFVQNRPGWRRLGLTFDPKTISTISRVGSTATATTPVPHQLRDGDIVEVSGATGADASLYNGTFPITTVPSKTFPITSIVGKKWALIARLNSDGSLDDTFDPGTGFNGEVDCIIVLKVGANAGKIIAVGGFTSYSGVSHSRIAMINQDGSYNTAFHAALGTGFADFSLVHTVIEQSDGKLLCAGLFSGFDGTTLHNMTRLNADGTLDSGFVPVINSQVYAVAICSVAPNAGKILIGGSFTVVNGSSLQYFARLNADGTADTAIGGVSFLDNIVRCISLNEAGSAFVGGDFQFCDGVSRNRVALIKDDGTVDSAFVPTSFGITSITRSGTVATVTTPTPHKLTTGDNIQIVGAVETDYNVLDSITVTTPTTFTYTVSGSPASPATGTITYYNSDTGFANNSVYSVLVQPIGSVMILGNFTQFNGLDRNRISRVLRFGNMDTRFEVGTGANALIRCGFTLPDFSTLIGGDFTLVNSVSRNRIAKLYPDGNPSFNPGTGANNSIYTIAVQDDGKILVGGLFTQITTTTPMATVTTPTPHGLTRGARVTITGATGADAGLYNGTFDVEVRTATSFLYRLATTPTANAVGSLSYSIPVFSFTYSMVGTPTGSAVGSLSFSSSTQFRQGLFQGAGYYKPPNAKAQIAVMINGQLFLITPKQFEAYSARVSNPILPDGRNNSLLPQAWLIQAEIFLLIQDGQSAPIIYDGSTVKRSDSLGQGVPVGKQMAYGMGRLWVANGRDYVASDIVRGPSGTSAYAGLDAILKFTENTYLNGGGSFTVPLQSGDITGMQFPANLDTSLGQQELLVLTERAVFSVNVPIDRTVWQNLSIPLQRTAIIGFGAVSANSIVGANSDLFYRSKDGIRSVMFARRDFGEWGNVPNSREMKVVLEHDDQKVLNFASAVVFDNRLLMTCSPALEKGRGIYHRGLVALDFDLLSSMRQKQPPAYDGLWSGLDILQVVTGNFGGVERCFALVLDPDRNIDLWEFSKKDFTDRTAPGELTSIYWKLDASSIGFDAANQQLTFSGGGLQAVHTSGGIKRLETADIFIQNLRGEATFTLSYSPDRLNTFQPWQTWSKCANIFMEESEFEDVPMTEKRPQYRSRLRVVDPEQNDDPVDNKPTNTGFEFQPRLEVVGAASIYTLRLQATPISEPPQGDPTLGDDSPCQTLFASGGPLFTYSSYSN